MMDIFIDVITSAFDGIGKIQDAFVTMADKATDKFFEEDN